jgi:hypothetical protein
MKFENITLKTVPTEKLIAFFAVELPENEALDIPKLAIYEDKFWLDVDCCFNYLETHFVALGKFVKMIEFDCRIKKFNDQGGYSIRTDQADFVKQISLDDYLKLAHDVKFTEFVRFNYNPRIVDNQSMFMKHLKRLKP